MIRTALYVLLLPILLGMSPSSVAACDLQKNRQFDFWLGNWEVIAAGKVVGQNRITKELGGCVLHESYSTPSGYAGESFNMYDQVTDQWHQSWVDNSGLLLTLNGQFDGKSMQLSGTGKNAKGQAVIHRITWTPKEDKSVRQHWQVSSDGGESWITAFDGTYIKQNN